MSKCPYTISLSDTDREYLQKSSTYVSYQPTASVLLSSKPFQQRNIRPLAKLGKAVKIADTSNQRKAKCEAMPAVAIAFRENAKPFDKADGVFNQDTFP